MDTATRVLRLLTLLTARPDWRGEELAERLGVTDRTVRRDVDRLRELGYPVHAMPGPAGGYRLGAGARLPPLLLDDEAAVAVALGLHAAASGAVAGMEEAALRAVAALEQVMPKRLRQRVTALRSAVVPLRADGPAVESSVLALLAVACREGERLRFNYRDRVGVATRRLVDPYRLVHTGRRWYLVAHDVDRDDWRGFRVDRLSEPIRVGQRVRLVDPPDAARFVAESISTRPYRWQARILCQAPAEVVARRVPPTAATVEALDEQRCVLVTGADSLDTIALHTALLDVPFTPLEPPELRRRCARLAERLAHAARDSAQASGAVGAEDAGDVEASGVGGGER